MSEDKLSMEERIKRASEARKELKRLSGNDSKYYEMMQNLSESIFDYSNSPESPIQLPVISNRGARKKLTLEERTRRLRMIRLFIYDHEPEAEDYFQALDEQIDANEKEIAFHKLYDPFFEKLFTEAASPKEGD